MGADTPAKTQKNCRIDAPFDGVEVRLEFIGKQVLRSTSAAHAHINISIGPDPLQAGKRVRTSEDGIY